MQFENLRANELLAAIEFRQRVRALQISDLTECILGGRGDGTTTAPMERKLARLQDDLAELNNLARHYAVKRRA